MKHHWLLLGSLMVLMTGVGSASSLQAESDLPSDNVVTAKQVAEFIHAVIEADRTLYTTHVVQRMHENAVVKADEAWQRESPSATGTDARTFGSSCEKWWKWS